MKSFEQFLASVQNSIQREMLDSEVEIHQVDKLGGSYVGVSVKPKGAATASVFNLEPAFERYQVDPSQESAILSKIVADAKQASSTIPLFDVHDVMDYERAKSHLMMQVVPVGPNKRMLETIPHQIVEGIAVVYRVEVPHPKYDSATTLVTNQLLAQYGITPDQLHADAVNAQLTNHPPVLKSLPEMMAEMSGGMLDGPEAPMWVATVEGGTNGASVVLYPGFLDLAAEKIGGDFFVLPSSVHEVLLVPDDGRLNLRELETMVRSINEQEVAPEDRLSDHVYHYDASDRVFELAKKD